MGRKPKNDNDNQTAKTQRDMLTANEAAKLCSVSLVTFKKWIREGKVTAFKTPGGHYRVSRYEVNKLLVKLHKLVEQEAGIAGRKTILIVDDEKEILDLLKIRLEEDGYEVLCAQTALNASMLVGRYSPELILLDISLNVMNGWQFFELLKKDRKTSTIPVIFMSGKYRSDEDVERGLKMGAVGFLPKPFELDQMIRMVKRTFSEHSLEK